MNESEMKQKELVKICIYLYGGCKYKSILTKTRILIYWNCKGSILLTSIVSGCRLRTIVSSSPLYTHSLTHNIVGIWQGGEMGHRSVTSRSIWVWVIESNLTNPEGWRFLIICFDKKDLKLRCARDSDEGERESNRDFKNCLRLWKVFWSIVAKKCFH